MTTTGNDVADSVRRRSFLGGSDARIIMGSDKLALLRLWREKRGETEPEDLSGNLVVQLGVATEDLNRRWYELNTGQVIKDKQRRVRHPVIRWMAATLDGVVEASGAVFEAKFMLPWSFSEEAAAEKHMAQLQHNMWVVASRCYSLGRGLSSPCLPVLQADPWATAVLFDEFDAGAFQHACSILDMLAGVARLSIYLNDCNDISVQSRLFRPDLVLSPVQGARAHALTCAA